MTKINKEHLIVGFICLLALAVRLFFLFQNQGFDYESYYALRQAEHIRETGLPLYNDPLSFEGRIYLFPPLFYYLIALFSAIVSLELAAKLVSSILFIALIVVVYAISKDLTKNRIAATLAALFSGFVPILYNTLNNVSILSLSVLLIFLLSYAFLRIEERGYPRLAVATAILLLLTDPSIFIFLLAIGMYFILLVIERQKAKSRELEVTVFIFLFSIWFTLLIYKKAFLINGIAVLWKNIPSALLSNYFSDVNFLGVLYAVGLIPLILGVYAIYTVFFNTKNRAASLYVGFSLVTFLLLWIKLIPLNTGLLFLSINLIILSSYSLKIILVAMSKTKLARAETIIAWAIVLLFALTSITPFFKINNIQEQYKTDISALEYVRDNTPEGSVMLGRVEEGFMISHIAGRKNVADSNYLFIENINQRYEDVSSLFNLRLKSEAIRLLNQYDVDYIFLSKKTQDMYNITGLFYAEPDCFSLVYDKQAKVYKFLGCKLV